MSFIDLKEISEREQIPGYMVRFVHSERMTLAYWEIAEGAPLPQHSHPHEQIANVIEGRFELTISGNTQVLEPGHVAVIPPNAMHSGLALTRCRIIDAFCPVREDYR